MKKYLYSLPLCVFLLNFSLFSYIRTCFVLSNPQLSSTVIVYGDNHDCSTQELQKAEQAQHLALSTKLKEYDDKDSNVLVLVEDDAASCDDKISYKTIPTQPLLYGLQKDLCTIKPSAVVCQSIAKGNILSWACSFFEYHALAPQHPYNLQQHAPFLLKGYELAQFASINDLCDEIEKRYIELVDKFDAYAKQHELTDNALENLNERFAALEKAYYDFMLRITPDGELDIDNHPLDELIHACALQLDALLFAYASELTLRDLFIRFKRDSITELTKEIETFTSSLNQQDKERMYTSSEQIYKMCKQDEALQDSKCFAGLSRYRVLHYLDIIYCNFLELEALYQVLAHQDTVKKIVVITGCDHADRLFYLLQSFGYERKRRIVSPEKEPLNPEIFDRI